MSLFLVHPEVELLIFVALHALCLAAIIDSGRQARRGSGFQFMPGGACTVRQFTGKETAAWRRCGRKPLLPIVRDAGALSLFDRDDHRRNNRDARQHVGLQLGLDVGHLAFAPCL